jgi:hypothetical protein
LPLYRRPNLGDPQHLKAYIGAGKQICPLEPSMLHTITDPQFLTAMAAVITAFAALVWAIRRQPNSRD